MQTQNKAISRRATQLWLSALLLTAVVTPAVGVSLSDTIFAGGAEPQLVIEGKIGYPLPLAGAIIEARFAGRVATASSRADGTYSLGIELPGLPVGSIVELIGFGTGANTQQVWASPIGPLDRLRSVANSVGRVNASIDPFVNLTPRTTAIAGAIRAYGGFMPASTEASYYRAARGYQHHVSDLSLALALAAKGALTLPASATNYFDAVNSLQAMQQLYASFYDAGVDCTVSPQLPYCQVTSSLPVDDGVSPLTTVSNFIDYSPYSGYDSSSRATQAYRFTGPGAAIFYTQDGMAITVNVASTGNGILRLEKSDGTPLSQESYLDWQYSPPIQAIAQTMALKVRPSIGPAGQTEHGIGYAYRTIWPSRPDLAPVNYEYLALPQHIGGDAMPSVLVSAIPSIAGKRLLLPLGQLQTSDPAWTNSIGYDIHHFSAGTSGYTDRSNLPFTYSVTPDGFLVNYGSFVANVRYINEEDPGIWRVESRVSGNGIDAVVSGLMLEATGSSPFANGNVVGQFLAELNGGSCAGPLGRVTILASYTNCYEGNGWLLASNNTVTRLPEMELFGNWSLAAGTDTGRLLLTRTYSGSTTINQRRGWERIRQVGNQSWILENVTNLTSGVPGVPPVAFTPTSRLIRVTLP